ncbi:MAG TPA: class I SAM-dependent methyltransferase [Candidatus Acidoferrales bacterium]|nr:class I SAM-dependent methyltransferase [Candidatus Acidoferrales bacterium]
MPLSSSAMEPSIYNYPDIFRRAHLESPGEIPAEVEFLQRIWARHRKRPVRRILDVACGDSPHGRLFAGDGFEVVGIDRSPTMIAAGRKKAPRDGMLRFYRRSIEKFTLPERKFDAAIFMSETLPVIVDNADLMSHLKSVGRALNRGGLYCVDIDRQDTIHRVARRTIWRERNARAGSIPLKIREFNRPIAWHSPLHSIYELECTIGFPDGTVTTRDLIPVRYTPPWALELAARASGMFEMIAAYADLSFSKPMAKCRYRWLGVLRRK